MENIITVRIEIPKNSNIKYEFQDNEVLVDRILQVSMSYPYNYGFIPNSLGKDNDPLDALVITDAVINVNALIRCVPICMLVTEDEEGEDEKIICKPISKIDPTLDNIENLESLPFIIKKKIEHFFSHYKDLEKSKWIRVKEWVNKEKTIDLIKKHKNS